MKERIVVGWSGGKDSALALRELLAADAYEVVSLVTTVTTGCDRVSMHGVRCGLLELQAAALQLPLCKVAIPQGASNDQYESAMRAAFSGFREKGVQKVAFGDLFLEEIRAYRDRLLASIGMTGMYPIWGRNTAQLAHDFVGRNFRAVLVCVDPVQINARFAGREFDDELLRELPSTADPCGENGEFHTFVYDGPIFRWPVRVRRGECVTRDGFRFCDFLPAIRPARKKLCGRCGAGFLCGPAEGKERCWCDELPRIGPVAGAHDCLCPACLRAAVTRSSDPCGPP